MSSALSPTVRRLTRGAVCTAALVAGVWAAALPAVATASPASSPAVSGATGLHDGMMPSDSPDARTQTRIATATVPTAGSLPLGLDVSGHQHPNGATVDWTQVAASGQQFAMVKATELYTDSTTNLPVLYTNPYLQSDLAGARAAGLVVGTYAFAHPENSAVTQADDFAAAVGSLPAGSLPPVLDLETSGGLTPAQLITWTHTFLDRLQADMHTVPMIYTGPSFWSTSLGGTTDFASYPLWEAHYTTANAPAPIGGWSTYALWQFSSTGTVPGISGNVDQDRFNSAAGLSSVALPRPSVPVSYVGSWFFLNDADSGTANIVMSYGDVGDTVLVADTDGVGGDKLLIRRGNQYFVRNSLTTGPADYSFFYGDPGDTVLVGDWDGDGKDTLAVRRGNSFFIKNSLSTGTADKVVVYGNPGDTVLVGDWDGDGTDTLAVRRGNQYFIKNSISTGTADSVVTYGDPGDRVLVGKWNGKSSGLAVQRGITFYLKDTLTTGVADTEFSYGDPGDEVLVGDWNGDGVDSLGVHRIYP